MTILPVDVGAVIFGVIMSIVIPAGVIVDSVVF